MKSLHSLLSALSKTVRVAVAIIATVVIFWAITYRFILGFTPLWMDVATLCVTGVAMPILWVLGRNNEFDYSRRIKTPSDQSSTED